MPKIKLIDCTLRDGGYYNNWDFQQDLVKDYLEAMAALDVAFVEVGFRSLQNYGFKGAAAYSTDNYISSLGVPKELTGKLGVMVNGSELLATKQFPFLRDSASKAEYIYQVLNKLFPLSEQDSPITLVRIACHVHEFVDCLPASNWLKDRGYIVGFNLMQVADRRDEELSELACAAGNYPIDTLYFADSMGGMDPERTARIISIFRNNWSGDIGIHTHDNMSQALANSLRAVKEGVTWVDCTVTGMGRGPGNVQTEYLAIALQSVSSTKVRATKLLEVIRKYFKPMQRQFGWGTNPYYYLAGQYGIHPSYIQEMLADSRYSEEDIFSVIEHLRKEEGGKKFSLSVLEAARNFYSETVGGCWKPTEMIHGRQVLILGSGPGVNDYRVQIEEFIRVHQPFVIALNTQKHLCDSLVDIRAACHPMRLLADCREYLNLSQPLVTPFSMLPTDIQEELQGKEILDFGLRVVPDVFSFQECYAVLPNSLVVSYSLAIATCGDAKEILLAGFDGYGADDPRRKEMDGVLHRYSSSDRALPITSITPTRYEVNEKSVFALIG